MGISSNQARLMTLTARQHDLELRAQQISAEKMIKGLESQEVAMKYSKCLNLYSSLLEAESRFGHGQEAEQPVIISDLGNGKFSFTSVDINIFDENNDYEIKSEYKITIDGQEYVKDLDGKLIPYHYDLISSYGLHDYWVFKGVRISDYAITKFSSNMYDEFYNCTVDDWTADDFIESVKAQYQEVTTSLSTEEKLLDMELTQINTEHNAVKTEYDSVKGLVGENVDKSFNVFS